MSSLPAPPPPSADGASPASPRPRRRRWKKIVRILLACAALATTLLALAGWHVWHDRTAYAQRALNHYLPDLAPTLDSLEISPAEIRVENLQLRDPDSGEVFGILHQAGLSHWRSSLSQRKIGRIEIDGLHLSTSAERLPALLAALSLQTTATSATAAETDAATPPPASTASLSIEGIDLTDLRIEFDGGDTLPSVSFKLDHHLDSFRLEAGVPALDATDLTLRDLHVTTPDGSSLQVPALRLRAAFDPADGILRLDEIDLAGLALDLRPGMDTLLQTFLSGPKSEKTPFPAWFKGIALRQAVLQNLAIKAAEGLPPALGLPALRIEARLEHHAEDLFWSATDGLQKPGRHQLKLTETAIQPTDAVTPGHLKLPELRLHLGHDPEAGQWQIEELTATKPDIHWTPQWETALLGPADRDPENANDPPARPAPAPTVHLVKLALNDAQLRIQETARIPLDIESLIELQLTGLSLQDSQINSSDPQRLLLRQIQTRIPGSHTAEPTTIESIELVIHPDALLQEGRIDRLHIEKPLLTYHIDFDALAANPSPSAPASTPAAPFSLPPLFEKLHFAHLVVTEGTVHVDGRLGAPFEADTTFNVTTEPEDTPGANTSAHTLAIAETRLHATDQRHPLPVARVGSVEVRVRLPEALTERRLESLALTGGQIEFGDALMAILDTGSAKPGSPPASPPPAAAAPATVEKKWHAGKVTVSDLGITLQRIAPGLPPLNFNVQFEILDTSLEPEGLVENIEPQRVELSSLTIPAPYGSLRPVARLDTIFVHFTLDGLLRRRIGKVEILNPTLYVGEPLFWYVDYYRNFAAGDSSGDSAVPQTALVSAERGTALAAAAETVTGAPRQAWSVEELQVHSGKLVLAPKGVPLPGFRQPFPFSFSTRLDSGQFEAVFDIPPDNYPLPDLKLEFIGMKGQVHFNMPMKDVNNNLTETFTVDQIRWKQLHIEKAHLSVTYDLNGIYGQFGGEAYEGYIKGGFDIYLNDSYTWDGWIAATGVRATEITQKLTPAYFLLDGKVNGTLIAFGDAKELYQADLDFTNTGPGHFSIAGLNDMLDSLPPPNTAAITDQFTRIGLETLRDFEYETVHAKGRLHGREGAGFLNISGPQGSRNIEVNVLDHRWKVDPPPEN